MWINITKEIFEKAEFKSLNFLYQILSWYPSDSSSRYSIVVDTNKIERTENFIKLLSIEKNLKEFLDIELTNFVTNNSNISYKIGYENKQDNFNVEEAIIFFNQPVSIILENNKNDSQFILAIFKYFGNKDKFSEYIKNGWITFENAGGCSNIANFVEGFLTKFNSIAEKNNKKVSDYFRGFVIIDSDKEFEKQASKHTSLINKLQLLGIDTNVHILEKRMMENYLPKEVFENLYTQNTIQNNSELKNWLDVYLNLTDCKQFDFLNITDGFPPKKAKFNNNGSRKSVHSEILNLFSLSESDLNFKKLDNGFKFKGFDKLGNLKSDGSFKEVFPNLFKKPIVSKQTLESRDGNGELQKIANKISNLI